MSQRCLKQLAIALLLIWSITLLVITAYVTNFVRKNNVPVGGRSSTMLFPQGTLTSGMQPSRKRRIRTETRQSVLESIARKNATSYACSNLTFPHKTIHKQQWQSADEDNIAYVFSAYEEDAEVKVIGASLRDTGRLFMCQLWQRSNDKSPIRAVVVTASRSVLPEHHGRRYTATYFTCRIPKENSRGRFVAISITTSACSLPLNILLVTRNPGKGHSSVTSNFTVCVSPFHTHYGRAYELVEWIELNRILGADKFIFYNLSIASNVENVLRHYTSKGVVEVIDWKLPMGVPVWPYNETTEEIHYFGQMASLNECLFRSRGRSEFIVNLDLDEFIIPRGTGVTTWTEMLDQMPKKTGAYIFANVFFRKEWSGSRSNFSVYEEAKTYRMVTLLRLQREKKIWTHNLRSKYMVRPYGVKVLGIHNIWSDTGSSQNVRHSVALLHHYRDLMRHDDNVTRMEDDIVVSKYDVRLLQNVRETWESLPGVAYDVALCNQTRDVGIC